MPQLGEDRSSSGCYPSTLRAVGGPGWDTTACIHSTPHSLIHVFLKLSSLHPDSASPEAFGHNFWKLLQMNYFSGTQGLIQPTGDMTPCSNYWFRCNCILKERGHPFRVSSPSLPAGHSFIRMTAPGAYVFFFFF